jgi:hypothetical protein
LVAMASSIRTWFRMPCGTVHPKQRVIRADVPGF